MELGRCPACAMPYTAADVAGRGVLRPRRADAGGPTVDYRCRKCDRLIPLVPHGAGRFAPPGEVPPEHVPVDERAPPWAKPETEASAPGRPSRAAAPPREPPREPPPSRPPGPRPSSPATSPATPGATPGAAPPATPGAAPFPPDRPEGETPLTVLEALDLLGVSPAAEREDVDRAFRERSLLCHPDKFAHLDAEFQALAARKFRRLREAYELLTR